MPFTRHLFTVALFGDLTRSGRHALIQRGIVPQRTDGVEPRLDLRFAGEPNGLESQPVGDGQYPSAPTSGEIPADNLG